MSISHSVKLGLLVGISVFIAAFAILIAFLLIRCCFYRKMALESDKRGSFKKLKQKERIASDILEPQFGEAKEYLYREGSLRSLDSRSASSVSSIQHGEDLRKVCVGQFEFTPTYYHERRRLQIIIRRVSCYPVYQSMQNMAYLYVVACLLPDRRDFFESELQQIHEDNLVDEMCEFEVAYDEIEKRVLLFEIHVCDRFSKHLIIGEFRYRLLKREDSEADETIEKIDFREERRDSLDKPIARRGSSVFPEFLVSLCYMPTSGRLTFVALKGKNLDFDITVVSGLFLRVSLIQASRTVKTVSTNTVRKTKSPVYNEAFVFHMPVDRVKDSSIIIRVITMIEGDGEKPFGKIIIGEHSESNLGRKHWEAMLLSARRPIAQWHTVGELV